MNYEPPSKQMSSVLMSRNYSDKLHFCFYQYILLNISKLFISIVKITYLIKVNDNIEAVILRSKMPVSWRHQQGAGNSNNNCI